MNKHILITGGAGFIGSNTIRKLLEIGYKVTAIDNFDNFYNKKNKLNNIRCFSENNNFSFAEIDIRNFRNLGIKLQEPYDLIIHLAARPGVRNSIKQPRLTKSININGTKNILEFAKVKRIPKVIFSSSSSVYGLNQNFPWREDELDLLPISPYAISKIEAEKLGKFYSENSSIQFIALRFFSVYGQNQRPDLAISKFISRVRKEETIPLFGDGSSVRDYTHVNDIVDGIISSFDYSQTNYDIFNLGTGIPTKLITLIRIIENEINLKAKVELLPIQKGDVFVTHADISKAESLLNYSPNITLIQGIRNQIQTMLT